MSSRDQHMINLLRRWISGEARRSDERALDQAAQQDNFLAEALEGYRRTPAADHETRLEDMRRRLGTEETQGRSAAGFWLRIAAGLALLLLAGYFVFDIVADPDFSAEAEADSYAATDEADTTVMMDGESLSDAGSPTTGNAGQATPPRPRPNQRPSAKPESTVPPTGPLADVAQEEQASTQTQESPADGFSGFTAPATAAAPPAATRRDTLANASPAPATADQQLAARQNQEAEAEANRRAMTKSTPGEARVNTLVPLDDASRAAEPSGGFAAFERYIKAEQANAKGEVTLRFSVLADGRLSQIVVLKSTNSQLSDLAKRLLLEGPRWEIKQGQAPLPVTYTLRF